MATRASYQSGPSIFKKLVRLVARTFYSGPCPPRPEGPVSRRKWERVDTTGIAIVILDHLAQQEWVKEENLVAELKIAPKLLLRALRFLEAERILRHESRKEGKRAQAKDIVVLVTKKESTAAEGQEGEAPTKPLLQSYWAIDYPSFWNVLRLRLHLMRFKIKSEVEDTSSVVEYFCPRCDIRYSTLDFMRLLNRQTGQMNCIECGSELLEESNNDGGTGTFEDRRKRRDEMKVMLQRMDTELKLIIELVQQAKEIKPPDYGCLADWAYEQTAKKKAKDAKSKREKGLEGDEAFDGVCPVAPSAASSVVSQHTAAKELPPWMIKSSRQELKPEVKRKAIDILPPPMELGLPAAPPGYPQRFLPTASFPEPKKLKIMPPPMPVPVTVEEDGIEWEEAALTVEPPKVASIEWEDLPFDAEAARLADIESDLRTTSGWTTLQK